MTPDTISWSGDPRDEQRIAAFLRRGDRDGARVIWWLEPDFAGLCDLLVTRELASGAPLRVRPNSMLRLQRDGEFSATAGRPARTDPTERPTKGI